MLMIAARLAELGDGLGLDHDLADLESAVGGGTAFFVSPSERGELLGGMAQ